MNVKVDESEAIEELIAAASFQKAVLFNALADTDMQKAATQRLIDATTKVEELRGVDA